VGRVAARGAATRRRRLVAAGLVLAGVVVLGVLAVVVVGGGGGCESTGYPDSPDCVAIEYAARADASKCDFVAPALLEEVTGARGPAARRRCAASVGQSYPPDEVEVLEQERVGDAVVVELLTDGREGKLTLARVEGRWRITSFAE